jgi:hypothetical protein
MGDSLPPPAEFDLVDSFARLRGDQVEIVLAEPKAELSGSSQTVTLRHDGQAVEASAELIDADGTRTLTVRLPRARLSDGVWTVGVRREDGTVAPLAARLLVQGRRPLVLLWGARAGTTHAPAPRRSPSKQRVVSAGKHALDRALAVLPEAKADVVRKQARTAARRLLG